VTVGASTLARFGAPVETDGMLQLRLANGVDVSISVVSDVPSHIDEHIVVCERGLVIADPRRGTLVQQDGATRVVREPAGTDLAEAFHAQMADFAAAVEGAPSAVSLAHSRHVVEVVISAYAAAEQGTPVPVGASAAGHQGADRR
ncbi:MAG: hypothetical protein ACRDQA_21535, partial [Nocardioidaceae bacterium]